MNTQHEHRLLGHDAPVHSSGGEYAEHVTDHNEYRDLNFKAILNFMVGLIVTVAISYISMYGILKVFESQFEDSDKATSPFTSNVWFTPGPDVQTHPHVDLVNFKRAQDSLVDMSIAGKNAMTVEQAMEEVVNEGLPYRMADSSRANGQMTVDTVSIQAAPVQGNDSASSGNVQPH